MIRRASRSIWEPRLGKAPGGFQTTLSLSRSPVPFMRSLGVLQQGGEGPLGGGQDDVRGVVLAEAERSVGGAMAAAEAATARGAIRTPD